MSRDTVTIPAWNAQGILPPIDLDAPTSGNRSPYRVSLVDFVLRFGNTEPRRRIVAGLLDFRIALQAIGLVSGFQWIDGSFLENIEVLEERDPRDIDVVTFFYMPDGMNQESLLQTSPRLFDQHAAKEHYHVDAYFVQLNATAIESLVDQSVYWNSVWSHRRSGQWKGYIHLDLAPRDDEVAKSNLTLMLSD